MLHFSTLAIFILFGILTGCGVDKASSVVAPSPDMPGNQKALLNGKWKYVGSRCSIGTGTYTMPRTIFSFDNGKFGSIVVTSDSTTIADPSLIPNGASEFISEISAQLIFDSQGRMDFHTTGAWNCRVVPDREFPCPPEVNDPSIREALAFFGTPTLKENILKIDGSIMSRIYGCNSLGSNEEPAVEIEFSKL